MENPPEKFEAATKLLLSKLPRDLSNKFNDEEWILYERYIPQALALAGTYNDSQTEEASFTEHGLCHSHGQCC
jgi:hypothetical protein